MIRARRREQGNVSIIAVGGVGLALVLCLGVARVGGAVVRQSRADSAADAAALAAADALALGHTASAAEDAGRAAARANDADLEWCACSGDVAEVIVRIGRAHGRARAVIDGRSPARISRAPGHGP